jgi:hypothetical protein
MVMSYYFKPRGGGYLSGGCQMDRPTASVNAIRNAIYYPFPFVQDENWLKEQAFFWDHLYRIVPIGFSGTEHTKLTRPTRTERVLSEELGFVKDLAVDPEKQPRLVGERLNELIEGSPWFKEQALRDDREYFSWKVAGSADGGKPMPVDPPSREVGPEDLKPRTYNFEDIIRMSSGAWRYFSGKVYMALLAKLLSASTKMPIATDDEEHDLILKAEDILSGELGDGVDRASTRGKKELRSSERQGAAFSTLC